jgi:hypothetical protein
MKFEFTDGCPGGIAGTMAASAGGTAACVVSDAESEVTVAQRVADEQDLDQVRGSGGRNG